MKHTLSTAHTLHEQAKCLMTHNTSMFVGGFLKAGVYSCFWHLR